MVAAGVCAAGVAGVGAYLLSRPAVTVTRVVEGKMIEAFYATGTVRPHLEYPIHSSVGGILEQVLVRQGSTVTKGQELADVIDPQLQYQADKARADLKTRRDFADPEKSPVLHEFDQRIIAAEQMLDVASQQEERFAALAQRNAASANDRDQAFEHMKKFWADLESLKDQRLAKVRELQEDVEVAEAADRAARENLRRQKLLSPIDGVVLDEPMARDTRVEVNGHIMQVADVRVQNLVIRAAVDEEKIARVRLGQKLTMTLYSFPKSSFDGTVSDIYPKADPNRRTFEVDVSFLNPDPNLRAGMTGELAFIDRTADRALLVPSQAVQNNSIWAVRSGHLTRTPAQVGLRSIEHAQVTAGLKIGDQIVISPIGALHEGQAVRVGSVMDPQVAADLNKPREVQLFKLPT